MQTLTIANDVKAIPPAVPCGRSSIYEFRQWIRRAEEMPSVSLGEARLMWRQKTEALAKIQTAEISRRGNLAKARKLFAKTPRPKGWGY